MATRMQQRRGTSAQWAAANPVLADGEVGYEKDTGVVKVGNGVSTWNQLAPILGSSYLPVLGKAADSERLDGLDSTAFAQRNYVDDLVLPTGVNRRLGYHHGTGDAFPTVGVKPGDTFQSLQKAMFIYSPGDANNSAFPWRQIDGPLNMPDAPNRTWVSSNRPYQLHPGFRIREDDTGRTFEWDGSKWLFVAGPTPHVTVRRILGAAGLAVGSWTSLSFSERVAAESSSDTTMFNVAQPWKLIAPIDGIYSFTGAMIFNATAGARYVGARKNDGLVYRSAVSNMVSVEESVAATFRLTAGQFVSLAYYTTVASDTTSPYNSANEVIPWGILTWIGNL